MGKPRKKQNSHLGKGHGMPPELPNLWEAASTNDVNAIKLALEYYQIDDQDEHGMTALHHAAASGANDAIDFLLGAGIDPTIKDNFDRLASWMPIVVLGPELGAPIANKLGPICSDYKIGLEKK